MSRAAPNVGPPPSDTGNCFAILDPGMVLTNVLIADVTSSPVVPTSTLSTSATIFGFPMYVMWESSDLIVINQTSSSTTQPSTGSTNSPGNSTKQSGPGSTAAPGSPPGPPASLSPGAKAGIAIAIVFFCLAIMLVVFVYFRRRARRTSEPLLEKPLRPNTHELITAANIHEMITKHNIPEIGGGSKPESGVVAIEGRDQKEAIRQMNPASHVASLQSNELPLSPQELEHSACQSLVGISSPAAIRISNTTETKSETNTPAVGSELAGLEEAADIEKEEQKLNVLRKRMERIRAEKERLTRIQELQTLEEQTKREILDAQKRVGSGGGS